ncbi:helix-turn-helix domain-containing protein [Actinomycetospora rhizophila]|uniref:Helix-turn-helix domain-containing protein n=1 Tax=Actinomycetospora rhizophila TaxID=1416876 RepID=A0ABV9ZQ04_9PSEU
MTAAADILRALNADEPREALLARIARHTCTLARTDSCSVMLLDDTGERLVLTAGHALTERYRRDLEAQAPLLVHPSGRESDLPAARAVRERRTVVLRDVAATEATWPWRELALAEGIRSLLAVPLGGADGRELAGVLVGYTGHVRDLAADELAAAELMAQYAGTVLRTAELRAAEHATIRRLERAEQQDRALLRLLLDDAGLDGVLDALAGALDASVTLETPEGSPLGRAGPEVPGVPPVTRTRALRRALAAVDDDRTVVRAPLGSSVCAWVVPIAVADELAARLWVARRDGWADRSVIERFSLLLALELLKRRRAVETELRLTRDLAVELVSGTGDERSLLDRSDALHHDLRRPHTVVLAPPGTAPAALLGGSPLVGEHEGALAVLVPEADRGRLAAALAGAAGPVVIGPTVTATDGYPPAWRVVRTAHALAAEAGTTGVLDLDDLGVAVLLLETGTPDGLRRLAAHRLGALEEHDRTRGTDLVATLREWVRRGCATADTARALHVHPHTISYRLRRVAELAGTDPRRQEGLFELQVALMVRAVQACAARP